MTILLIILSLGTIAVADSHNTPEFERVVFESVVQDIWTNHRPQGQVIAIHILDRNMANEKWPFLQPDEMGTPPNNRKRNKAIGALMFASMSFREHVRVAAIDALRHFQEIEVTTFLDLRSKHDPSAVIRKRAQKSRKYIYDNFSC